MPRPSLPPLEYARPDTPRKPWLIPLLTGAGVAVLLLLLGAGFLLPSFQSPRPQARQVKCANNLRQIGLACLMYANDHGNQFPDTLGRVLQDEDITPSVFVCPSTTDTPAPGASTQAYVANLTTGHHLSYIYVGKGLKTDATADTVVAYEPLSNHGGTGMNVLNADGHVEFQDAKTASVIVAEVQMGHNPPRTGNATTTSASGRWSSSGDERLR